MLWPTETTLRLYAETRGALVRRRQMVGVHDLWIAACALEHNLPLLTRNAAEFARIPNLKVVDYSTQRPSGRTAAPNRRVVIRLLHAPRHH